MSTIIKTIKDFFDNTVYPITKTNAVYDSNNNRLDNVLASKQDASSNFVYKGTGSATPSIDDPELRQSDISTTQSTSDITVPSSSLVKTMNDNLGNPSSASAVTGADAFSKISKLNSDLASMKGKHGIVFYAICPPSTNYGACRITFGGNYTGITITLKNVVYRDGADPNIIDITSSCLIVADSQFPRGCGFCLQITNPPCLDKYVMITVDFD